jgi:hypothetical protein
MTQEINGNTAAKLGDLHELDLLQNFSEPMRAQDHYNNRIGRLLGEKTNDAVELANMCQAGTVSGLLVVSLNDSRIQ